jgi:hypothetical protein
MTMRRLFNLLIHKRDDRAQQALHDAARLRWRAVSIVAGSNCCDTARRCGSRRWLSAQAPRFPLPGCDASACKCRYRHHPDRRARPRRRADRDEMPRPFEGNDRRKPFRGRRAGDSASFN